MQVVKYLLFSFLLLECSLIQAQGLEGYEYLNDSALQSTSIKLNKSSRFTLQRESLMGHSIFKSHGYYLIAQDTLILVHEKIDVEKSSFQYIPSTNAECSLAFQNCSTDLFIYNFNIKDEMGETIPYPTISFFRDGDYLFSESSDDQGRAEVILGKKAATEIRITKLGYELLVIKSSQDLDKCCAKLNIQLQPSSKFDFNEQMFIEKFLIKSDKGLKKKLVNVESGETLRRKK